MMHINALLLFFSGRIGMVSVANAVIRQENVLALWKGLVPVGVIEPWSSTNYMCTKIIFVILRIIWLTCFFPFFQSLSRCAPGVGIYFSSIHMLKTKFQ